MPDLELFQTLAISIGLGLLVGLQRQHQNARIAGIRTFPLITVFGTVCAWLAQGYGGWVVAAGALSTAAIVVVANLMQRAEKHVDIGQTTEASLLLMYAVGAYLAVGNTPVAVAIGATVAVLLHLKETLHQAVAKLGEEDLRAIMQFVVISLVILPILPDKTYGPYQVLNPYNIWLMVVLIVGIGLAGYFAYKAFGSRAGTLLGGTLGGLISSTATTVSFSRRAKGEAKSITPAAFIIFMASTIAFLRMLVEIAVVAPKTLQQVAPPLAAVFLLMLLVAIALYFIKKPTHESLPEQGNPAQLNSALAFGAIYALVVLATAYAKDTFGNSGLYIVAIISGLTDVDAITLSTSRLMHKGNLPLDNGWRVILVAALSNLAFKAGIAAVLGGRQIFFYIALLFGVAIAGGLLVLWLWPQDLQLFSVAT